MLSAPDKFAGGWGNSIRTFSGTILVPVRSAPLTAGMTVSSASAEPDGSYEVDLSDGSGEVWLRGATHAIDTPVACNTAYCVEPGLGPGQQPLAETFTGLRVNGQPATVQHVRCCVDLLWSISWAVPGTGATYSVVFEGYASRRINPTNDISRSNARYAQTLADFAASLVPIQLDATSTSGGQI